MRVRMKRRWSIGAALTAAGLAALGMAQASSARPFSVQVAGVRGRQGTVRCLLFTGPHGFPNDIGASWRRALTAASADEVTCTFSATPEGRFAVSVVHDVNDNDKLDSNLLGVPTEGYAFSRDAKAGLLGPPSYDDAALTPAEASKPQRVHLVYP